VTGTVVVDTLPVDSVAGPQLRVRVDRLSSPSRAALLRGTRLVAVAPSQGFPAVSFGRVIRITGSIVPAVIGDSPSWWRRYVERQGIAGRLQIRSAVVVGRRGGLLGIRDRLRSVAIAEAGRGLRGDLRELVRGIALGGTGGLSEATTDAFRAAGLAHLLAVSGQNIAIVSHALLWSLLFAGVRRRAALTVALAVIVVYCVMCDGGPSVVRAGVMGALGLVCQVRSRAGDRWYLLAIGLAALLIHQPRAIHDPGLQLSFAAVVGLLTLSRPAGEWLEGWLPPKAAGYAGQSLAATLATAPVVIATFGELSLVGLVVNVVAVPLAVPIVIGALAGILCGILFSPVGVLVSGCAGVGAAILAALANGAARLPAASVGLPPWVAGVACAVLGTAASAVWRRDHPRRRSAVTRRRRQVMIVGCAVVALGVAAAVPRRPAPTPWPAVADVTVLDVGQGDAILLRSADGEAILIDTGPPDESGKPAPVIAGLRRFGVRRLGRLALTHDQRDHNGAAEEILDSIDVDRVDIPVAMPAVARAAVKHRVAVATIRRGDTFPVGHWRLAVLWPPERITVDDPNDASLVIRADAPGLSVLLTGDAEGNILGRLPLSAVDVLKVSHHGSDDPDLPTVLRRLRPRQSVISAGQGNRFGHPRSATLDALAASGTRVLRTDRDGDVTLSAPAPTAP
jgi:competence protein ComEC